MGKKSLSKAMMCDSVTNGNNFVGSYKLSDNSYTLFLCMQSSSFDDLWWAACLHAQSAAARSEAGHLTNCPLYLQVGRKVGQSRKSFNSKLPTFVTRHSTLGSERESAVPSESCTDKITITTGINLTFLLSLLCGNIFGFMLVPVSIIIKKEVSVQSCSTFVRCVSPAPAASPAAQPSHPSLYSFNWPF